MEKSEFIEALQVILYRCSKAHLGQTLDSKFSMSQRADVSLSSPPAPSQVKGGSAPAFRSPCHPSPGLQPVHSTGTFSEIHLSLLHEGVSSLLPSWTS